LSVVAVLFLTITPHVILYILTAYQRVIFNNQRLNERYGNFYEGLKV